MKPAATVVACACLPQLPHVRKNNVDLAAPCKVTRRTVCLPMCCRSTDARRSSRWLASWAGGLSCYPETHPRARARP